MGSTHLGYGIFVRFQRSRLPLRRGIAKLEDALALAEQFRAERFHAPDAVFIVKEPEGTIVTIPTPADEAPIAADVAASLGDAPPLEPAGGAATPEFDAHAPASLRWWTEQLRMMQQALAWARVAQARLESAYGAGGYELQTHGATPPEALARRHERLAKLCDATRRTVVSAERSTEIVERHCRLVGAAVPAEGAEPLRPPRTTA